MSVSYIPSSVKLALWGRAAGRCQYRGCNRPLWKDDLTQAEFNVAYLAHIVADQPDGPRGDAIRSKQLRCDPANLLLLCDQHHRLIDVGDVAGHPEEDLVAMKDEHERRIQLATDIGPEMQTEILCYDANIGRHNTQINYRNCVNALTGRFPASTTGIKLGWSNSALADADSCYWVAEQAQLHAQFDRLVLPRLRSGDLRHVSVFGIAPQPLLMTLGHLLSDLPHVDVYQRRREPQTWRWADQSPPLTYHVDAPATTTGTPALVLGLSATVTDDRIVNTLADASIWRLRLDAPHNDFMQVPAHLHGFRASLRSLFDRIKAAHSQHAVLHVFPAMPVSAAVEFGRVIMPKADLPMKIYDQQPGRGFIHALDLNFPPGRTTQTPTANFVTVS